MMMNKKLMLILLICTVFLSSCSANSSEMLTVDISSVSIPESLGCDFIIFDSDGDGVKDDIAEFTCLGMTGGYGSFKLEVYVSEENCYRKMFDSEQYMLDEFTYKKLSENIDGELIIDTFYSVEAIDTDNDGCEELVCRQYAWTEYHSNHIGDVVSTLKVTDDGIVVSQTDIINVFS